MPTTPNPDLDASVLRLLDTLASLPRQKQEIFLNVVAYLLAALAYDEKSKPQPNPNP